MDTFLMSPTIGALASALAKAQVKMEGPKKENTNPAFRSKYADYESTMVAIRKSLAPFGIAITQSPMDTENGYLDVSTALLHADTGEWLRSWCRVHMQKDDPQGWGSALTYALRRSALAMCGMAPEDDDDDGAAASVSWPRASANKPQQPHVSGYRPSPSK